MKRGKERMGYFNKPGGYISSIIIGAGTGN